MKVVKTTLVILLIALLIIQFFRPEQNKATVPQPQSIAAIYGVPPGTQAILQKACYDCHSNNTAYPWYNNIQPVAWWLDGHIRDGKDELNFDEFGSYSLRRQNHKLEEVAKSVKTGYMPLGSYTIIHTDARLSDVEKSKIATWANGIRAVMAAKYPADSLVSKPGVGHH